MTVKCINDCLGTDVLNLTSGSDVTAELQAAINEGKPWRLPAGTFLISSTLTSFVGAALYGHESKTIIKRDNTSTQNALLSVTTDDWVMEGIVFDGNKAGNANACNCVNVIDIQRFVSRRCSFINAKSDAGFGAGLTVNGSVEVDENNYIIDDNQAYDNDATGILVIQAHSGSVSRNLARNNGSSGIDVSNLDQTFVQKIGQLIVDDNRVISNAKSGIVVSNFYQDNDFTNGDFGFNNQEVFHCIVSNNVAKNNGIYGIVATGEYISVNGNTATGNSTSSAAYAGIGFWPRKGVCSNNVTHNNSGRGIEAGGARDSMISGNTIYNNPTVGISCGGAIRCKFTDNWFQDNGGSTGSNILLERYDGADFGLGFDFEGARNIVSGNFIRLGGTTQIGIKIVDGCFRNVISDNVVEGTIPANMIVDVGHDTIIDGNRASLDSLRSITIDGSDRLYVPDIFAGSDHAIVTNTGTVDLLHWTSGKRVGDNTGVAWCDLTAGGTGYTAVPTVTFTGGGGSGAAGTALTNKDSGSVVGIRLTAHGSGYTSAPTVSFSGGGGTGATATAQVGLPVGSSTKKMLLHFNDGPTTIKRFSGVNGAVAVQRDGSDDTIVDIYGSLELQSLFDTFRVLNQVGHPTKAPSYTVSTAPAATMYSNTIIYISDESGGATLAFSDGTNWRRVKDLAVIS